jgi:hypothetical protein
MKQDCSTLGYNFHAIFSYRSVNDFDENEVEKDKSVKGSVQPLKSNSSSKWSNNQARENAVNTQRERKNKANRENADSANHHKDEYCLR